MKKNVANLFTVVFLFATLGCQTSPNKTDVRNETEIVIRAENLENSGKQDDALAELETGLRIFPGSVEITRAVGRHHLLLSKLDLAEVYLKKAQDLDPKSLKTILMFGALYSRMNQPQKSLEYELAAYKILPEDVEMIDAVGWGYWGVGNFEKASEFFAKYLKNAQNPAEKWRIAYFMQQKHLNVPPYRDPAADLLDKQQFDELEKHLTKLESESKLDSEGDYILTKAYDDMVGIQKKEMNIGEWNRKLPESAFAQSVLGTLRIEQAWQARGSGYGSTVSELGQKRFKEGLADAKQRLQYAIAKDPRNPESAARVLRVTKGVGDSADQAMVIYRKAVSVDPNNFAAARQMMSILSPRWGGSTASELNFAREAAKTMGKKSKAPLLVIIAHWDLVETLAGNDAKKYFSDPAIWKECKAALEEAEKRFPNSIHVKSLGIQTAYFAGDIEEARKQLKSAGGNFNLNYWINDRASFVEVKERIL